MPTKIAFTLMTLLIAALLFLGSAYVFSVRREVVTAFQFGLVALAAGAIWLTWTGRFAWVLGVIVVMVGLFWWLRS